MTSQNVLTWLVKDLLGDCYVTSTGTLILTHTHTSSHTQAHKHNNSVPHKQHICHGNNVKDGFPAVAALIPLQLDRETKTGRKMSSRSAGDKPEFTNTSHLVLISLRSHGSGRGT